MYKRQDSHWLKQAEILLTSLLWLAANSEGRTITDVVDWVPGLDRPTETSSGTVAPLLVPTSMVTIRRSLPPRAGSIGG